MQRKGPAIQVAGPFYFLALWSVRPLVVVAALLVHTVVVLLPTLRIAAGLGVVRFLRGTSDALMLACNGDKVTARAQRAIIAAIHQKRGVYHEVEAWVESSPLVAVEFLTSNV